MGIETDRQKNSTCRQITVIQSIPNWLSETVNWLYNLIYHLPDPIENYIVCESTKNLDSFRLPNIINFSETSRWRYYWDKGLRKMRIRRHLGFLVEQARVHGAHVLHSHFGDVAWANLGAARRAGLRHVVSFYGYDVNRLVRLDPRWKQRYRTLFDQIDCVLCEGSYMAQGIVKLGCPTHKIRVHHLGVSLDKFPFRPRTWNSHEPLRILIAATFREKKGIPCALETLGRLQHKLPLQITIIGDATYEERSRVEKEKILAVINKHNLGSKTRLLGYQPHAIFTEEAYKHHVFFSPSKTASDGDSEGGAPVSIIEMAASGMPIISTRHCDIPEVIHHGVTGLLADEEDVEGLLGHFERLVERPDLWRGMLEAGRRHIELEYDVRNQSQGLAAIYRKLVEPQVAH